MSFFTGWLSHSGGLIYHLRAFRYSQSLWGSHREALKKFLSDWQVTTDTLVLIGPSGGYSLPREFLSSFKNIIIYEPDPIAKWILKWRFRSLRHVTFDYRQAFDFQATDPSSVDLPKNAAILFCNLLGQIEVKDAEKIRANLAQVLSGRAWASFHDWFSGQGIVYDGNHGVKLQSNAGRDVPPVLTVQEHVGRDLLPTSIGRQVWDWQLIPDRCHVIEGVCCPHAATILVVESSVLIR
jgi:hypothetical protein